MFMNFWWPLATSADVTPKPLRVTALQQEFVLYRLPDGRAQVLSDLCVHRGGALSDGWLEGACIVCPYHGWQFAADGACVKIPANQPGVPVPKKARVDAYPTVEKDGWVFAFLGDAPDAERPPMADAHAAHGPLRGEVRWRAPYAAVMAHFGEPANALFVLGGDFDAPAAGVSGARSTSAAWGARVMVTFAPPDRIVRTMGGLGRRRVPAPEVEVSVAFHAPNVITYAIGDARAAAVHVPVDAATTVTKWMIARVGAPADVAREAQAAAAAIERLRPAIESGPVPDNPIAQAVARVNAEALARGWSIDSELISAEYANVKAVVIPSPARREVPELAAAWVMKKVPTRLPDF